MTFTSLCADNARQGAARALPCVSPHAPRGGAELPPRKTPSSDGEEYSTADGPRILIVEDILLVAWHLESLVRELDYEVCGLATDGQHAIEQAADSAANVRGYQRLSVVIKQQDEGSKKAKRGSRSSHTKA